MEFAPYNVDIPSFAEGQLTLTIQMTYGHSSLFAYYSENRNQRTPRAIASQAIG